MVGPEGEHEDMTRQDSGGEPTHVAYADESKHNVGRYRGVALISLRLEDAGRLSAELEGLFQESGITEFRWKKVGNAKYRFAAIKMLGYGVEKATKGLLRVDVLTWDTEDSRHKVRGRDDIANLQRMYYHLFRHVLRERWPDGSLWRLCPDENTALDWDTMEDFLNMASSRVETRQDLFSGGKFRARLKQEFSIEQIVPRKSHEEPLVQLGDLFVGFAVYSRTSYNRYKAWQRGSTQQLPLFEEGEGSAQLSLSDQERCQVLDRFDALCKRRKLGVSLKTHRGLWTPDPKNPVNFWWYEPQHEEDRAPVRSAQSSA